jgi:hypothetical protein
MRANRIINYESILQVLGETGCPFCRLMKNYQAGLLQDPAEKEIHHLCNFHTWGLAATQRAVSAAHHFLNMLERHTGATAASTCDICVLLEMEEDRRIREFASLLNHKLVAQWLRLQPILCYAHGTKLKQGVPQVTALAIDSILENYRLQLMQELRRLRDEHQTDNAKWGVLGHAAEFLATQRGLRR